MSWNEDEDVPTRVEHEHPEAPAAELDALDWEEDVETRVTRRPPGEEELALVRKSAPPPLPAPSGVIPAGRPSSQTLVGTGPGAPSQLPTRVVPAPSPSITAITDPPTHQMEPPRREAPAELGKTMQDARPPEMDLGRPAADAPPGLLSRPNSDRISAPPASRRSGPPPLPRAAGSRPSGPPSIRPSTPGAAGPGTPGRGTPTLTGAAGASLPRPTLPPLRHSAPPPIPSAALSSPTLREPPTLAHARAAASTGGNDTHEMPTARVPPANESLPEPATMRRLPSVSAPPPRPGSFGPSSSPPPTPRGGLSLPPPRLPPVAPVSPTADAFTLGPDFRAESDLGTSTPEPTDATTVPQVTTRMELHREVPGARPAPPFPAPPMVMGDVAIGPGVPAPVAFPSTAPGTGYEPAPLQALAPYVEPVTEPSGWSKIAALLGALSLVISIGLGAYLLWPRTGQLRVEIADQAGPMGRVEVFVDGQKRCETTPCVITDLTPGAHHVEVGVGDAARVAANGEVVAGRERMLRVPLARTAVVKAAGAQPGVKVYVDGKDHGPLPAVVKEVAPGQHKIAFDGGDRYEPLEENVETSAGQTLDMGTVVLPVKKGLVTVHLDTPGATVLLVAEAGTQKILPGPWPMTLDVQTAQGWKLVARKSGFREMNEPLTFTDGNPERTIHVALEDASAPAAPAPVAAASPAPAGPRPGAAAPAAPAAPPAEPAAAPAAAGGPGTLNANSMPPSKVLVDGKPVGNAPVTGISLPPGTHTVTFVHPELGKKVVTVEVKPGERAVAAVRFKVEE